MRTAQQPGEVARTRQRVPAATRDGRAPARAPLPGHSPAPADGHGDSCLPAVRAVASRGGAGAADHHAAADSMTAPLTSQTVMVAVRELAGSGASGAEIARETGLPENRISEARTILRLAPDLADVVARGRMGLAMAYRAAVARHAGPIDLATVTDVTVAQMARLLHVCPDTVYRAIRSGDLETDPTRHPIRIPAAAARAYLATHGATSGQQEDLLRPAAAATVRGLSTGTLARSAGRGQLPVIRTPGGHHRYPAAPQ
jgi:hypothetical protein